MKIAHNLQNDHPFVKSPHKTLLSMSLPVLLSLVAEPLTGLVDTAFVARLGAESLAALGVGAGDVFPASTPIDGSEQYYLLSMVTTAETYALSAAPNGPQTRDRCGTLTLNSNGARGISGADAGITVADCW